MKNKITDSESPIVSQTSLEESVRIEVEPKSVVQTSPETFEETLNTFNKR